MNLGDFALETTVYAKFTTVTTTGAPTTLSGSPVVSVYENDDNTQITAGITLTVDEDGVTGLNQLAIAATAANGYEAGKFYVAVITTGTVGGTSVVGYVVASFTIEATSALKPTTAGRKLDVSAGGEAGVDWANIGSPTSANNLSGTNIDTDQVVASVTGAVGSVTGAVGSVTGAVGSVTGNVGGNVVGSVASVTGAVGSVTGNVGGNVVGSVASVTGNVGGNVAGSVASVTGAVGSVGAGGIAAASFAAGAIDAAAVASDTIDEIWAKTMSELAQAAPSATPSMLNAIALLYMVARNQITVTATTKTFSNDAGTVTFKKALSDDGTTYTEAEMVSGP